MIEQFGGWILVIGIILIFIGLDQVFTVGPGEKWFFGMDFSFNKLPEMLVKKIVSLGFILFIIGAILVAIF